MTSPPLLGSGREADVFALDAGRVLRRYRDGSDAAPEAAVMAYLAEQGYPVPIVYEVGGTDLVMERVNGPTMLAALMDGDMTASGAGALLAGLHNRLHAVPPPRSSDPADRILHLDLHPLNIILSPRGPFVIDWRNTIEGPPGFDTALTALMLGEAAIGLHVGPALAQVAPQLLAGFLAGVDGDPVRQLDWALARRCANPTLSAAEIAALPRAADQVRACAAGR